MESQTRRNKRIAKNSLFLYFRMLLLLLIGLYTSRVTLDVFGVEDYGLYNLVGGIITISVFVSSSILRSSSDGGRTAEISNRQHSFGNVLSHVVLHFLPPPESKTYITDIIKSSVQTKRRNKPCRCTLL